MEAGWRGGPRARRGARVGLAGALAAALALAGGCAELEELLGEDDDSNVKIASAPYTTSTELDLAPVIGSFINLNVDIPEESLAMGIVAQGTGTNRMMFVEHEGALLGGDDSIRDPKGKKAPLAFNEINDEPFSSFINPEAAAVHFPNDGRQKTLRAGTWKFPIGQADLDNCDDDGNCPLVADSIEPFVYYKTETGQKPTLKLNVFVLDGVSGGILDDTDAQNDPEIQGAVSVLENVYANNASTSLNVVTDVIFLDDTVSGISADGVISDETDQYTLLSSVSDMGGACPDTQTHDAMNIFVVAALDNLPGNVIGVAAGIPGPFNRHCTAMSGTLAEYQGDGEGTILGFILAHEFGHFLGLYHTSQNGGIGGLQIVGHDPVPDTDKCKTTDVVQAGGSFEDCPDRSNLMFPLVNDDPDPPVSVGQGNVIKFNPGVRVP